APASAFYLGVYEIVRGYLSTTFLAQSDPLIIYLLAGAIGELFGSIVRAPTEAVKTRVQAFGSMTTREAIDSAFSEKGREGMLRSWAVSLWRDVPMGAIQLALFEGLKAYVISAPGIDFDVSTLSAEALFGAIGGAVGALVTTPFDIITVLTISSLEGESNKYTGMGGIEIAKDILATKGPKGLFQGSFERTVYWAPAIGIFLSVYCSTRQMGI
ncbi:mitochondrial carrier domain-containing protein, partial [Ochromonadaceae sp. CCMP2298]